MDVLHNVYSFGERSNMGSLQNGFVAEPLRGNRF